ncbi:MAG: hypothetical protein ACKPKO_16695, partial [Candidatus Fonsibacter sp.]
CWVKWARMRSLWMKKILTKTKGNPARVQKHTQHGWEMVEERLMGSPARVQKHTQHGRWWWEMVDEERWMESVRRRVFGSFPTKGHSTA